MEIKTVTGFELVDKIEGNWSSCKPCSFEFGFSEYDEEELLILFSMDSQLENSGVKVEYSVNEGRTYCDVGQTSSTNHSHHTKLSHLSSQGHKCSGEVKIHNSKAARLHLITDMKISPIAGKMEKLVISIFKPIVTKDHIKIPLAKFEEGKTYTVENIGGLLFITCNDSKWESGEGYRYHG